MGTALEDLQDSINQDQASQSQTQNQPVANSNNPAPLPAKTGKTALQDLQDSIAEDRAAQSTSTPPSSEPIPSIGRYAGLGARAVLNGITGLPSLATDIPAAIANVGAYGYNKLNPKSPTSLHLNYPSTDISNTLNGALTDVGLPNPATKGERIGSDITSALAGSRAMIGGGQAGSGVVSNLLQSNPALQYASSATGAGAGGVAREDYNATPGQQLGISLLAGAVPSALSSGASAIGGGVSKYIEPLTSQGPENIANRVIGKFAGDSNLDVTHNEIVPGSKPTMAELTANPGIANLQDTLRDMNAAPFVERTQQNSAARNNLFSQAAGTPLDIESAIAERNKNAQDQLAQVFANPQPTSAKPVVDTINNILDSPEGKRDSVVSTLNNIKSKLVLGKQPTPPAPPPIYDSSGNVMNPPAPPSTGLNYESDPQNLYGVRKQINDLLDKSNFANPAGIQAAKQLIQTKDALDGTIEQGAPGFKDYINNFSSASKPIDAMQWMQGLNLTDSTGNITLSKIQNTLRNVNKLQNAPGTNAAQSLSEDQVNTLQSIRDDLLRQQNLTLGKSVGSPTVQKATAQNILQQNLPGKMGLFNGKINPETIGAAGGAGVGSAVGAPGAGAFIGSYLGNKLGNLYNGRNQLIINKLQDKVLNPELYNPVPNTKLNPSPFSTLLAPNISNAVNGTNRFAQ